MVKLDTFDGHIVLWCKGHYTAKENVSLIDEIRRIWAIRCGLDYKTMRDDVDQYIANSLYRILVTIDPGRIQYIHEIIHEGLVTSHYYGYEKDMSPIQKLIYIYRSRIMSTQIKEKVEDDVFETVIDLPEPQVDVFKRITNGGGEFMDYELIKELDTRFAVEK